MICFKRHTSLTSSFSVYSFLCYTHTYLHSPGNSKHSSSTALACGGMFGFLLQSLTGWQPNMPKTLSKLAEEPVNGQALPVGFAESEDGSVENEEMDISTASLSLLRHLMADGVPCAPLEQFKFDEIYRSQGMLLCPHLSCSLCFSLIHSISLDSSHPVSISPLSFHYTNLILTHVNFFIITPSSSFNSDCCSRQGSILGG